MKKHIFKSEQTRLFNSELIYAGGFFSSRLYRALDAHASRIGGYNFLL